MGVIRVHHMRYNKYSNSKKLSAHNHCGCGRDKSAEMGGKMNRRRQADEDWEATGTDESDANAPSTHNTLAGGEDGDANGNEIADTLYNGGRAQEGKRPGALRRQHVETLRPVETPEP